MKSDVCADAANLVQVARTLYKADPAAARLLDELDRRLQEPLRLALAGIVKAGKSTLLNAILGEQIAPTDAGECTRVVTWYRYSDTPYITLHLPDGSTTQLPVRRVQGKLVLELGGRSYEEIERIEIGWPSSWLKSMIIIDTPGIAAVSQDASMRSADFLIPDDSPSSADAIVYLLRHLHPSDLGFLESFRDTAAGPSQTVNAVAVLSRADEIGSGRIDSLLSAQKVAFRYEQHGELASLALGVIPVAGLLAEGARTLRESEFFAFKELAEIERRERERLLLSADRFVQPTDVIRLSEQDRRLLLDRFGIFGVRLAASLIRAGAADATELAGDMLQHSGLEELTEFIRHQFGPRTTDLKVRAVLDSLERLTSENPQNGMEQILTGIERIRASAHSLKELSLLSQSRVEGLPLPEQEAADAVRIIGGGGTSPEARLGLSAESTSDEIRSRVEAELGRWRARCLSPLTNRPAAEVYRAVIRSLEEVASHLGTRGAEWASQDIVAPGSPSDSTRESTDDQRDQSEAALEPE